MRVTQLMLSGNMQRYLSRSYERLGDIQEKLMTGKKIVRPSDDPVVAMKGMTYRSNLTEIEQYQRNLSEAFTWIESADSALEHATSVLHRARELIVQIKNGTYGAEDRQAVKKEIEQLKEDLVSVANTQVAGKYIFNGTDILSQPVDPATATPTATPGRNASFTVEVAKGIRLPVNVDPDNVFDATLFNTFKNIEVDLQANNTANLDQYLSELTQHLGKVVDERAELGARMNRLELVQERLSKQEVIANKNISDNEDADMERIITDLKTQESVHRAVLGVGARIIQPTLLDFLR
ncbi:flagellar hook-associated protein FlgL [Thermolongibacillus altinsuensis]|uniref:flagellar hook-associated protein FlgL n=1 Tax=Thermolongibacillus altinsuensis TaxID=575256 RepID=UPI00242A2DB3|nr:flagellar hook-associated protein FlgL [Thermolongibacillus altinsuensis]GMB09134.1 flagellar hook-associated protein 3 [Thermolongibacillus altinsuensis]